ncbi:MAG: CDP-alcohol phosphatidyltransferase family protein [Flavobacteriaceae bacterium]|nr:CDP-alcohol phosphatidyltransferase family protein [Flavobacteriaceae bacterium]
MKILKHIPNTITLLNLLSGVLATIYAAFGNLELAGMLIMLGIFFDFFDGFFARLLNVQGELGKQLDSLADLITSGLAPSVILFQIISINIYDSSLQEIFLNQKPFVILPFLSFLVAMASAYRLANFNIDENQTNSFIGLPTPANALFILAIPFIFNNSTIIDFLQNNMYFYIFVICFCTYMLNANIALLSLKFKNYNFKENIFKYILIISSIILLITLHYLAIPIIILIYILLSLIENSQKRNI